jgi:hypothetical protein
MEYFYSDLEMHGFLCVCNNICTYMMTGDGITVLLLEIHFGGNVMGMKPNWNMCVLFLKILLNDSVHHEANYSLSLF